MMSVEHLPVTSTEQGGGSLLASLHTRAAVWLRTCANYYAASAVYEDLAGLSDAELRRRGLSRDTIARQAINVCTRDG
jgi:hypothetical protein